MKKKKGIKRLLWPVAFLVLAGLSFFAVARQSEDFSLLALWECVKQANPVLLAIAFCCTIWYVLFEGIAIKTTVREFGQKCSFLRGAVYSSTDIYFSAITPSAIGGQPACALFMMKDGITGGVCAVALLCGLMMYSVSIVVIGIVLLILRPETFTWFSFPSQMLIAFGTVAQLFLVWLFYMLIWHVKLLHSIAHFGLRVLKKLHLTKHYEERKAKLDANIDSYSEDCKFLKERPKLLFKMFLCNLGQRGALMLVTVFCVMAFTRDFSHFIDILAIQCFVTVGSNCVPVPGGMGVYDLLLLDGFTQFIEESQAVHMELVSRSMSFYSCIIFCGLVVVLKYLSIFMRERRQAKLSAKTENNKGVLEE